MMEAYGYIEVVGLVPAVAAADAAQPVEKRPEPLKPDRPMLIPGAF